MERQMSDSFEQGDFAEGYVAGFTAAYEAGHAVRVSTAEARTQKEAVPAALAAENHASIDVPSNPSTSDHQGSAPRSTWEPDALRLIVNIIEYATDEHGGPNNVCEMLAIVIHHQFHNRDWASNVTAASVRSTYNALSATQNFSLSLTKPAWIYFLTKKFRLDIAVSKWQADFNLGADVAHQRLLQINPHYRDQEMGVLLPSKQACASMVMEMNRKVLMQLVFLEDKMKPEDFVKYEKGGREIILEHK